jgi:hypothetical protein
MLWLWLLTESGLSLQFDLNTLHWTSLSGTDDVGLVPTARIGPQLCNANGTVLLFGGRHGAGRSRALACVFHRRAVVPKQPCYETNYFSNCNTYAFQTSGRA